MRAKPTIILLIFILLTCLNWSYVLWVKYQFYMLINAWFILLPVIGFFYFTFALIASCGLYQQKQYGLTLAYGIILFGSVSAAISYMLVSYRDFWIDTTIVPLLLLNMIIVIYMGLNKHYFPGD